MLVLLNLGLEIVGVMLGKYNEIDFYSVQYNNMTIILGIKVLQLPIVLPWFMGRLTRLLMEKT